jgi:thioredoxin reductase
MFATPILSLYRQEYYSYHARNVVLLARGEIHIPYTIHSKKGLRMVMNNIDTVIIGAGPYGLSIAAHLAKSGVTFRIFGSPMQSWLSHMPKGMLLKSEGFASGIYDPDSSFTLRHYCREMNLPYDDVGNPVPLEVFSAYGLEFQKRLVPTLEQTDVTSVIRASEGFEVETADGQTIHARTVIVATGITHFSYLPSFLADLPSSHVSHSYQHHDLSSFRGKTVVVLGAGASAVDMAAILHEEGSQVQLVARRKEIAFHTKAKEPRPLQQRMRYPRSTIGIGWSSRLCTDVPLLFHALPQKFRFRFVREHLGPAPGWFVRDKVVGKFPLHLGCKVQSASIEDGKVHLKIVAKDGSTSELVADHVISATGYRVSIARMGFLGEALRRELRKVEDTPVLSSRFETSVPGLYMVGLASAYSFGPLTRFACGAEFTAKHISKQVTAKIRALGSSRPRSRSVGYATD